MKKQFFSFALVATIVGSIAMGCSSEKKAGSGTDSTKTDSTAATAAPTTTPTDTTKKDTAKSDTSKKVPQ